MSRHRGKLLCAALLWALMAFPASADMATYNFDAPQFTSGETTPLLIRSPNVGPATFLTSFTSSPTATGFSVTTFTPNPLFSGQSLYDPGFPADVLTLTFNMLVSQLQVDFALNASNLGPFGRLDLTSLVGNTSQAAADVGPAFQGGTLTFNSAIGFTTVQLAGFDSANAPQLFAIDNLILNILNTTAAVPEPNTFVLLGSGLAGLAAWRRRQAA